MIEKLKTHMKNPESLSELEHLKTEVSLKIIPLKNPIYSENLHHLSLRILKVFLAIVNNFK